MKLQLRITCVLVLLVLCLMSVSCSASTTEVSSPGESSNSMDAEGSPIVNQVENQKIVYNVNMRLETTDVESVKNQISEKNKAVGGYIENNNEKYSDGKCTSVSIIYRVPTEKLDEFVASIEGNGGVLSKRITSTDITTEYVNAEARRNALVEKKELLKEILDDEGLSSSDRMAVINEISDVNVKIQEIDLKLNEYNSKVSYSTVEISISNQATIIEMILPVFLVAFGIAAIVTIIIIVDKKTKK